MKSVKLVFLLFVLAGNIFDQNQAATLESLKASQASFSQVIVNKQVKTDKSDFTVTTIKSVATLHYDPANIELEQSRKQLENCTEIDLKQIKNRESKNGHTIRLIDGIGYDWYVLQLGEAIEQSADPKNLDGTRVKYEFSGVTSDSVTVHVYSLPFWALHKGKSSRYGISVDGKPVFVSQSDHKEYSDPWKDRVLQNGVVTIAGFAVKKSLSTHTLSLTCGDPGMMIQRVVIDWGGLKKTYVGPSLTR